MKPHNDLSANEKYKYLQKKNAKKKSIRKMGKKLAMPPPLNFFKTNITNSKNLKTKQSIQRKKL